MIAALAPALAPFSGSYDADDVHFLMKPVALAPTDVAAKERLIQSGARHYSEMVPHESVPGEAYLALYRDALARNGARLAGDIVDLAGALAARAQGRPEIVIASLARAGTPVGVLLRRALRRLGVAAHHVSISIIRDRGVDRAALRHIAARHDPRDVVFVDGWTGKGAIAAELRASLADGATGFAPVLAVVADPAGQADLAATSEDYLIPSGILNAIVSGLVSRSILNDALVGAGDFHACVHHRHLAPHDLSRAFVDAIDLLAQAEQPRPLARGDAERRAVAQACEDLMARLMQGHDVADRNRIKPGIAEATRAVLRRLPERLLVRDREDPDVRHLLLLAGESGLEVGRLPADSRYRAVTIIRTLGRQEKEAP
jgi:Phosphoribosyl transferase (PRTase)/PELOTA RNA binding domain